ncbi:hypothetical protein [Rubellimicrobium mesophilum]|uniref:hypothetical protein n=1 Tax=Rubellimicrobium mesophilum TaxID=1123067 RepID=UPI00055FC67A|nr:hypothetical protein [Rubellimicrobium mesophilum]
MRELQSSGLDDVRGLPIKLCGTTFFHGFIVADIASNLDEWTSSWHQTVGGRGRICRLDEGIRSSIALIGRSALPDVAKAQDQVVCDTAGISGESFFVSTDAGVARTFEREALSLHVMRHPHVALCQSANPTSPLLGGSMV